jgi:hypothetical protein|tara:strand:+ start:310 stop:483 length:174 start_codon:yes stop_codon:yes gene_type:complete
MVKMVNIEKSSTVAESIARLNASELQILAEIMVNKHIADDLEFLLLNAKAEKLRENA